ncbi:hypothetical protein ACLOBP_04980 [Limosilactobacillus fermentum]|uniref:hypothetical protein n=1 Tax=Limosilactobacillus fermentum TaxID=1613 RepID=UPI003EB8C80F
MKKTEKQLYNALLEWVETADSTPSDPDQGIVITYQADDGTLSFWKDFYESDFQSLDFEDLSEAEEALGYDKIAGVLLDQVKSSPHYTEDSAKNFIEYLEG